MTFLEIIFLKKSQSFSFPKNIVFFGVVFFCLSSSTQYREGPLILIYSTTKAIHLSQSNYLKSSSTIVFHNPPHAVQNNATDNQNSPDEMIPPPLFMLSDWQLPAGRREEPSHLNMETVLCQPDLFRAAQKKKAVCFTGSFWCLKMLGMYRRIGHAIKWLLFF